MATTYKVGQAPWETSSTPTSYPVGQAPWETPPAPDVTPKTGFFRSIGNALISSEKSFGQDIAGAASAILPKSMTGVGATEDAQRIHQDTVNMAIKALHNAQQTGGDTKKWLNILSQTTGEPITTTADLYPALKKSNLQVLGDAGGVLLDVLSAGSYGKTASGVEFLSKGGLLTKAEKVVAPTAKVALSQTLKTIGVKTAERSAVGAGTGYAYDVSQNIQSGKTGGEAFKPGYGTLYGAAVPLVIGGVQAGVAISKETAPRFINSLIKPSNANFSYGKDPGRTVSELGITGNSLPDFQNNIRTAKSDIGSMIGAVYDNPTNAGITIDAQSEIAKLDSAISTAAKGGKSNQSIVTALQNAKDALLYEHQVNADGVIEKIGTTPVNTSSLSPKEAQDLIQQVAGQTKFTGNPTDDKTVNAVLKSVYGGIREKINTALEKNSPEIVDLNQKYADLTSAELAVTHRDMILSKSNLISLPIKVGGATALITALSTGGAAVPAILAGVAASALDKALESTAVKTRVASWLGSQTPSTIAKILQQNPGIRTTLYRLVPKLSSQIGQQ